LELAEQCRELSSVLRNVKPGVVTHEERRVAEIAFEQRAQAGPWIAVEALSEHVPSLLGAAQTVHEHADLARRVTDRTLEAFAADRELAPPVSKRHANAETIAALFEIIAHEAVQRALSRIGEPAQCRAFPAPRDERRGLGAVLGF